MAALTYDQLAEVYMGAIPMGQKTPRREMTIYTRGEWHRYKDGVWSPIHELAIGKEVVLSIKQCALGNKGIRLTDGMASSVERLVKKQLFVEEDKMDADPNLINLKGGVYNLETGTLMPPDPKHYMTTQLPFKYDPNAVAPKWSDYVKSTFVQPRSEDTDQELIDFVQEAVGYSLTTSVKYHKTFWCLGSGANGKGVLFHILFALGGDSAVPFNAGILRREQYQLADLQGKRVALCAEVEASQNLVSDGWIKMIVGGDPIQVRQIRERAIRMNPTVKLWWSMNVRPAVVDTSDGFWRRVLLIPFNRKFKPDEQNLDLKDELSEGELPGVFLWAMAGLKRLNDRGKFAPPPQVVILTQMYRNESNPLVGFIEASCRVGSKFEAPAGLLYAKYKEWCINFTYRPKNVVKFKREMELLGHDHERKRAGSFYAGLELKPVPVPIP